MSDVKKLIKYVLTIDRSPLFICSQAGREIRNSKRYGLRIIRVNQKCCIVSNLASVRAQILNWSLAGFRKHVKFLKSLGGRDFADLKSCRGLTIEKLSESQSLLFC